MPFVKRHRTYYKYGTEPNATIVGSFARIDKGVASGFSASNYCKTPSSPPSNILSYEWFCKFTVGSDVTSQQGILANLASNRDTPQLFISTDSDIQFLHPISSSTWSSSLSAPLTPNTTYWIKVTWDGSIVSFYYKTSESSDYILAGTTSATTINWTANVGIGIDTTTYPFYGSIDLTESYININGERWWSGDSYTKVGSWIDDGVVGVFSSANYLTLPTTFKPENNTWEMCFKVHTPVSSSGYGPVLGKYTSDIYYGLRLEFSTTGAVYYLVSGTSGAQYIFEGNGANILPRDSDVYMKLSFTGSKYIGEISLDGGVSWKVDDEREASKLTK